MEKTSIKNHMANTKMLFQLTGFTTHCDNLLQLMKLSLIAKLIEIDRKL